MTPGVVVCWSGYEPRLRTIRIPPAGLVLGREYASETDEEISRRHVRVRVDNDALNIEDLGSRNGTFVNRWRNDRPMRAPFSTVIRAGHTVFVVVRDVEIYEELHEGRWGAALDRARTQIEDAARAEQNVTVEAGSYNAIELVRRYSDTLGGNKVVYQPLVDTPSLDASLADQKPRVVVLQLTSSALSFTDMPTIRTWLETDVRFVTVMWPGAHVLSRIDPWVVERLRERVIAVANPRYDELPFRVRDIANKHAPGMRIHASVCEGMLLKSSQYDEEWVVPRFTKAVAAWYANRAPERQTLRMRELIHDIDPPPPEAGSQCVVGMPPHNGSY